METPIFSNQIPTQNTQNEIDYKNKKIMLSSSTSFNIIL